MEAEIGAGLVVVRLTEADVDEAVTADVAALMTQLARSPRSLTAVQLRRVVSANELFVARSGPEAGGRIVGTACLVPMFLPQGVNLLVESVIVDEAHRGQGLGLRLMSAVLQAAERYGARQVRLTSNPSRVEAHRLYEKLGFTVAQTAVFDLLLGTGSPE